MILGHLPATLAASGLACGRFPGPPAAFVLAYLPDLLDKNLYYVFGLTSRGYFHSLPVAVLISLAVFAVLAGWGARDPGRTALGLLFFYALHILCDWVSPRVLLWPLYPPGGPLLSAADPLEAGAFHFWEIVRRFYVERAYPAWLAAEAFSLALALVLGVRFRLARPGNAGRRQGHPSSRAA
jgi:membrane-bound metal-dependent hydrolase YbcI (DUF457 family)